MLKSEFVKYVDLIKIIRKHQKLAEKRHPAFSQNKVAKFFMYFSLVAVVLYLMMFAVIFSLSANSSDTVTPCEIIYGFMPFILAIDFFVRFLTQQTPSQLVKPYVLLPIPRLACVDSFLASSLMSWGNLIWFALFIPYSIMSVLFAEGLLTTMLFLVSLYILILANSQWYAIIRTLINRNILWWILPIVVYGIAFSPWYIGKGSDFSSLCDFYAALGNSFVVPKLLSWLLLVGLFVVVVGVNRVIQSKAIWFELAHVEQTKLRHVSSFTFLEHFGIVGEYMKLEAKSAMRNKVVKKSLIFANLFVLLFSLAIAFTDIYDTTFFQFFLIIYCFSVYGSMILVRTMSAEGNYIEGLMVHRENILSLLTAKYYFYSIMLIVPFLLMLPTVIMGKFSLLMVVSVLLFSAGFIHCSYMQFSVYNKQTLSLNTKFVGNGNMENNYVQVIASLAIFFLPVVLINILYSFFSEITICVVLMVIGLSFILSHRYWMKNLYSRMMKRKYVNMDGFRASR